MTTPTPPSAIAFRTVQLEDGTWCVDFLGHAFIADPEPTQKDAEWLAGELQKDLDRYVARAMSERDERIKRLAELGLATQRRHDILEAQLRERERELAWVKPDYATTLDVLNLVKTQRDQAEQEVERLRKLAQGAADSFRHLAKMDDLVVVVASCVVAVELIEEALLTRPPRAGD